MVSLVPDKTGRVNVQSEYYIFSFFKPNSSIGKGQKILETNYNIFITSKNTEICSNSLYLILSSAFMFFIKSLLDSRVEISEKKVVVFW